MQATTSDRHYTLTVNVFCEFISLAFLSRPTYSGLDETTVRNQFHQVPTHHTLADECKPKQKKKKHMLLLRLFTDRPTQEQKTHLERTTAARRCDSGAHARSAA